jgi:hypothetical protein
MQTSGASQKADMVSGRLDLATVYVLVRYFLGASVDILLNSQMTVKHYARQTLGFAHSNYK